MALCALRSLAHHDQRNSKYDLQNLLNWERPENAETNQKNTASQGRLQVVLGTGTTWGVALPPLALGALTNLAHH